MIIFEKNSLSLSSVYDDEIKFGVRYRLPQVFLNLGVVLLQQFGRINR